jgi:DtxR family Mn-dependent transcriptional regulator
MPETVSEVVETLLQRLYVETSEGAGARAPAPADETALREAQSRGYVAREHGVSRLTPAGIELGRDVLRRRRLAECLLFDVLSAPPETSDEEACVFEHILKRGLDERVCRLLGHPTRCPHGKPIPEGDCCRHARADTIRDVAPLCDGKPGAHGSVAYLATRDNREVQKMMAMGILPGAKINLIQRFPSYVFQVGYSQFAVDRALAEIIFVHWTQ